MENGVKYLRSVTLDLNPKNFKTYVVGDPWYLEEFEGAQRNRLVVDLKRKDLKNLKEFKARVSEILVEENGGGYTLTEVAVCGMTEGADEILKACVEGEEIKIPFKEKQLGVDTASVLLCAGGKATTLYTRCDGTVGCHVTFTGEQKGFCTLLGFDSDAVSFDNLVDVVEALYICEPAKEKEAGPEL